MSNGLEAFPVFRVINLSVLLSFSFLCCPVMGCCASGPGKRPKESVQAINNVSCYK